MTDNEYFYERLLLISQDIDNLKQVARILIAKDNESRYDDPRCTTKVDTTRTSTFDKTETTGTSTNGWVSMCDH